MRKRSETGWISLKKDGLRHSHLDDGSDSAVGTVIFMESESCYYTYLIMATKDMYDKNKDVLMESVLSLRESQ